MADNKGDGAKLQKCEFVKSEEICRGKWLKLDNITYTDPHGKDRLWESAGRTTTSAAGVDAVGIMAILKRTLKVDCVICIKQYRPPVKAYTLEFPAGLVDASETLETAAIRELKEETGYTATIEDVSAATALDPGASSCNLAFVTVEIDGDDPVNDNPKQVLEDTEFIEVMTVPVNDLMTVLKEQSKAGVVIDSRVYSFAIGQAQANKTPKLEPSQK